jgi:hypothetical protein
LFSIAAGLFRKPGKQIFQALLFHLNQKSGKVNGPSRIFDWRGAIPGPYDGIPGA